MLRLWRGVGPGQEFVDRGTPVYELSESVGEPSLRIDTVELGGPDQRGDAGPVGSPASWPAKRAFLRLRADGSHAAIDDVGIDLDATIIEIAREAVPVVRAVAEGGARFWRRRGRAALRTSS